MYSESKKEEKKGKKRKKEAEAESERDDNVSFSLSFASLVLNRNWAGPYFSYAYFKEKHLIWAVIGKVVI